MAAAQSWEAGFPPEIAELVGTDAELQFAIVEHRVPMPGGGYPSQCDVFALAHADQRDLAVAVEAKVNESFGPTIGDWLQAGGRNRAARLGGICDLLHLPYPPKNDLRYQLYHRTAAAVIEARRLRRPVAAMIVQSFSSKNAWLRSFQEFAACFGMDLDAGTASETVLPDGLCLRMGWACGDPKYLVDMQAQ